PRFPIALQADRVEQPVVLGAVALEEKAQVQQRLGEQLPVLQQERDEQATDAAVAVEKRVDGLELDVHERGADERRQVVVAVDVLLKIAEKTCQLLGRRRDENGVARTSAADPVLAASQLARLLAG